MLSYMQEVIRMKKRLPLLMICAAILLVGVFLWTNLNKEPDLPSFWWHGYNDVCSVSLRTPKDSDLVFLESYENGPVDVTTLDGGIYLTGKRRLKGDQLTLKMEDGTVINGILQDDTIQLDYAGGVLLKSYETFMERLE